MLLVGDCCRTCHSLVLTTSLFSLDLSRKSYGSSLLPYLRCSQFHAPPRLLQTYSRARGFSVPTRYISCRLLFTSRLRFKSPLCLFKPLLRVSSFASGIISLLLFRASTCEPSCRLYHEKRRPPCYLVTYENDGKPSRVQATYKTNTSMPSQDVLRYVHCRISTTKETRLFSRLRRFSNTTTVFLVTSSCYGLEFFFNYLLVYSSKNFGLSLALGLGILRCVIVRSVLMLGCIVLSFVSSVCTLCGCVLIPLL